MAAAEVMLQHRQVRLTRSENLTDPKEIKKISAMMYGEQRLTKLTNQRDVARGQKSCLRTTRKTGEREEETVQGRL